MSVIFPQIKECDGGFFDIRDRLFLTTNEKELEITLAEVSKVASTGDTIIGVLGFCILNIAAMRLLNPQSTLRNIIVIDRGGITKTFWLHASNIIRSSQTKEECLARICANVFLLKDHYFPEDGGNRSGDYAYAVGCKLKKEISKNLSWLSDDERFFLIKQIFDNNRFQFFRLDFSEQSSFAPFIHAFEALHLQTDTLYLSNVHEYLVDDDLQTYASIVERLLSRGTILIDTVPRDHEGQKLFQRGRVYGDRADESAFVLEDRDTLGFSYPEDDKIDRAAMILRSLKFNINIF